jgi:hypothetical protein
MKWLYAGLLAVLAVFLVLLGCLIPIMGPWLWLEWRQNGHEFVRYRDGILLTMTLSLSGLVLVGLLCVTVAKLVSIIVELLSD